MSRSILLVHHLSYETGGHVTRILDELGLPVRTVLEPDSVPDVDELAGVVLFGGEMSAADVAGHPSVGVSRELARRAVDADVPTLGLCLGHQILALALGAEHFPASSREVGLVESELVAADPWLADATGPLRAMQWNDDTVSLPAGATLVARSASTPNTAFRYGSALGLQFHLEVDDGVLEVWDRVPEPRLSERLPMTWDAFLADYRGNRRLHDVAERGIRAFAEACTARV